MMNLHIWFILLSAATFAMAKDVSDNTLESNRNCPFKTRYIKLDMAYHECIKGFSNGSCDRFIEEIKIFLPEYDCQRSFDSVQGKEYFVPAIWKTGAAQEDYTSLLYKLASSDEFYKEEWFETARRKAKEVLLSREFKNTLDGHLAEEYIPLIEGISNENQD